MYTLHTKEVFEDFNFTEFETFEEMNEHFSDAYENYLFISNMHK